jgi:4-diphosphocytidyl-2C-methyl-D-erythritol kinase
MAGAGAVFLSGSGPTVAGIFRDLEAARRAADGIERDEVIVCEGGRGP